MKKRWTIKESPDEKMVNSLASELNNMDHSLASILVQRDITDYETAKHFFRPQLSDCHDPFLMKDMEEAVERINKAISNDERILIYGDYDVDGTTSVALVYSVLGNYYDRLGYYIPDRYSEGYGVSYQGIDYAIENNYRLIIALDCGIKAVEKVDYAKEHGVDFIICDHHRPGDVLPKAEAVLDPKREDCEYPFKELSGCGVGYKLMHAWSTDNNHSISFLNTHLDLLAISTCADIVPILDENRIYVHEGLKVLNEHPRPGVKAMIDTSGVKKEMNVTDVVFTIAPRINAAGRIESGNKAVELLISENQTLASEKGAAINRYNIERKDLDKTITAEAIEIIQNNDYLQTSRTTVLFNKTWHKGVIGIVASRLIETYYRPTIILTESNGKATGSARSVKGFDVYNAIDAASELVEQFGGHKYAAGLTLRLENIEAFQKKFEAVVNEQIEEHQLTPEIVIDAELKLNQINQKFFRILSQFGPFGPGNMKPIFKSTEVLATENMRIVGNDHLKFEVFQIDHPEHKLACIGFGLGKYFDLLAPGVEFKIVYTIEENYWNGVTTIQVNIKDLELS